MTPRERAPSPFPGLKRMVEWENFDRERGVPVDPKTCFLCPGCGVGALVLSKEGARRFDNRALAPEVRAAIDACAYADEHERMRVFCEVAIAKYGTRLRFLGERFGVDYDPNWGPGFMADNVGWVGEMQKLDYDHRVEVATQERWVTLPTECFELAPGAPLGPLGGPLEYSVERSRWASTGNSWLGIIAGDAARLRARRGATVAESLRLARVDLECFIVQDREWQAEERAKREERARRGEPPPCR